MEGIRYSHAGQQESGSITRRPVAWVCIEALETTASINRIIEIIGGAGLPQQDLERWLVAAA